jgi:hypothetical protein
MRVTALASASMTTLLALVLLVVHTSFSERRQTRTTLITKAVTSIVRPRRVHLQNLDLGVSWAQGYGIDQGFVGEPFYYPYVETPSTSAVLETENREARSTEARYPFVKYYGQAVDFVHGNTLDPTYYNYAEEGAVDDDYVFDNTLSEYSKFLGLKPELEGSLLDLHGP